MGDRTATTVDKVCAELGCGKAQARNAVSLGIAHMVMEEVDGLFEFVPATLDASPWRFALNKEAARSFESDGEALKPFLTNINVILRGLSKDGMLPHVDAVTLEIGGGFQWHNPFFHVIDVARAVKPKEPRVLIFPAFKQDEVLFPIKELEDRGDYNLHVHVCVYFKNDKPPSAPLTPDSIRIVADRCYFPESSAPLFGGAWVLRKTAILPPDLIISTFHLPWPDRATAIAVCKQLDTQEDADKAEDGDEIDNDNDDVDEHSFVGEEGTSCTSSCTSSPSSSPSSPCPAPTTPIVLDDSWAYEALETFENEIFHAKPAKPAPEHFTLSRACISQFAKSIDREERIRADLRSRFIALRTELEEKGGE